MKLKQFGSKKEFFRYFAFFFLFVTIYNIVVSGFASKEENSFMFCFYLLDYSFGFCTRFLPGAFFHLFFKQNSYWQIYLFCMVVMLLLFALTAALLAKVICLQKDKRLRRNMIFLFLFLLTGTLTFSVFWNNLGVYDLFWVLFSCIFIILIQNKYLKFFIPVIFILSIMLQLHCWVSFILLYIIILLYEIVSHESKEKNIYLALLIIGFIGAVAMSVYFLAFEKQNLVYNWKDAYDHLKQKDTFSGKDNFFYTYFPFTYYDVHLPWEGLQSFYDRYMIDPASSALPAGLVNVLNTVLYYFLTSLYYYRMEFGTQAAIFAIAFCVSLPLIVVFYSYWVKKIKLKKGFMQKLPYLLSIIQYPLSLLTMLFTFDIIRVFMHAFLVQFVLFIYLVQKQNDWKDLKNCALMRTDYRIKLIYLLSYMLCVLHTL